MIRVSTNTIFDQGVYNMQTRSAQVLKTQDQIASGRRVLTPADDPVSAARALEVSQSKAITEQHQRNGDSANTALGLSENALASVTKLLQDVKTLTVNAGDGALTETDLNSIATNLKARYSELLGLANTTDGNGLYLFSGFQGNTQPFSETTPGNVAYNGDQGRRLVQISPSRQVPVSDAGSSVFQLIKNGNGSFATAPTSTNTGTGIVSPGSVTDQVAWSSAANSQNFTVKFWVDTTVNPNVTSYDIVDNASGKSLLTGAAASATGPYLRTYTDGASIKLKTQSPPDTNPTPFDYGAELSVKGAPASGDSFTVKASTNVDMFTTLNNLITAVDTAARTPLGNTQLANSLNIAHSNLDNALTNVLTVRAGVGSRLKEVDDAQSSAADVVLEQNKTLSTLRDLDYAKAISDLTQQQTTLQAAQQSFAKIQGLSLFNYIQ
jgi:flagellar hook-associated protein 3 FlgL